MISGKRHTTMRNLHDILERYFQVPERSVVLATLFSVQGSHVYRPGALLALTEDGETFGCISAGCLENDISSHAATLFECGGSKMIHYCAEDIADNVLGLGLGCGGSVCVLLERLPERREDSHLFQLDKALKQNITCKSVIHWQKEQERSPYPPQRTVYANDKLVFGAACDHDSQNSIDINDETRATLITIHKPHTSLTIFGAGEIATALHKFAEYLRWQVTTISSTEALDRVAEATHGADMFVLLTHNDELESDLLKELLPSQALYVGVLGSRSRITRIVNDLKHDHPEWPNEYWSKLHAPVGLDIGSESAQEIALSIVAEIISSANNRFGEPPWRSSAITRTHSSFA